MDIMLNFWGRLADKYTRYSIFVLGESEMNVVAHNLVAMNAQRQFNIVNTRQSKTTERLSSGYKINRAADDAAGLSISEKMRRQIRGLHQAAENIEEGIGYVQTADGALNEAHEILQRMNELTVKSANGTNTDEDREFIDCEVQQLKEELDRIFETTTFNERRIWEVTGDKKQIGTEKKQAVTSTTSSGSIELTNDNYDVLASGSYKINADAQGISISWKGYNNTSYETEKIDWDTLKAKNYTFNMGDYFKASNTELFEGGKPVFNKKISFTVREEATIQDICDSLNGLTMYSSVSAYMDGRFEDGNGAEKTGAVSVRSEYITYGANYASRANGTDGRDFDAADDTFFEPTGGSGTANLVSFPSTNNVSVAKASTVGWSFSFQMDGIQGLVKAQSTKIKYASSDTMTDDNENLWWHWERYTSGGVQKQYQARSERTITGGTLGNVMEALTGARDSATPGLLNDQNDGVAETGGYIDIYFDLTADNSFSYGSNSSNNVGSFVLRIDVDGNDTEQTVLDKINASLNSTTVLDFYSKSGGRDSDSASIGDFSARTHKIDVPIMGGACEFFVQAGVEANQHINIIYDSLSLLSLGLEDTNVLTTDACDEAITDIKEALKTISLQRSNFGAYQNRLEHAYKSNKNVEENTTASESAIRDTDMAETMVEYSNQNILIQAGQAMMAQANQSKQGILTLLG